jgi:uncharacterized protein (DUF58 family)
MLTRRAVLLLLLAVPVFAAGAWTRALIWAGWGVVLLCLGLFWLDWRRAETVTRFDVSRRHDTKLSLGAENPVGLVVRNRRRQPATLWLRDEPPEAFEVERLVHAGTAPGLGAWEGGYWVRPVRRGDYAFGDITLRWLGPLGLVMRQGTVAAKTPIKVYPNLLEVRRYDLLLRQNRLQMLGLRHTRQFGEGTEFERLRDYQPDDEYRRINWKATARRNRPVTMEYQTERSQNIMTVVDVGRMMQSPVAEMAKLDYVINAVLLLAYVAAGTGDKVGLTTFADDAIQFLAPRQGRGQFYRMLEQLYGVEAQPVEPNYARALTVLAHRQRKRALMIIFTDLSGGATMASLVTHATALARTHLPLVVTISDPDVVTAASVRPMDTMAVYRRAAAHQLLDERQLTLETLARRGVLTLDVPANQLSVAVINRYLALKGKHRL